MSDLKYIFRRKIYEKLKAWKATSQGSTAVLIEGARRIGKSTITEQFARNEYETHIKIDFSKASKNIHSLFEDISNLDNFFMLLQLEFGVRLTPRKSLIIFDEVQFAPKARQAIKHLVADGRFDYIETGSLISIKKNVKNILIPSEEVKMNMYPMDFEEFLWAIGQEDLPSLLRELAQNPRPLGDNVHRKMMYWVRLYILVGGMPQAIVTYLDTQNLEAVDATKRTIIDLYESDFAKIDGSGRIAALFDNIPGQLSKKSVKYVPTPIIGRTTENKEIELYSELKSSMTVNFCYHTSDPNNGLAMDYDKDFFKLYTADTGIFITLAFKDKDFTENIIYKKILSDKLSANLGSVYENLISQMLVAKGRNLFYYTFKTSSESNTYEIDFLLSSGSKIDPIEVKSSGYKTHKSLDYFCTKFSHKISHPYVVYTKDYARENGITYLPVYLLPFI